MVALLLGFAGVGAGFVIGDNSNRPGTAVFTETSFLTTTTTQEQTVTTVETVTRTVVQKRVLTETLRTSAAVYVPEPAGNLSFRPGQIGLADHTRLRHVRWQTYGGATAFGRGFRSNPNCAPACPSGQRKWHRVNVEVSSLGVCHGVFVYRRLRVNGVRFRMHPALLANGCIPH